MTLQNTYCSCLIDNIVPSVTFFTTYFPLLSEINVWT